MSKSTKITLTKEDIALLKSLTPIQNTVQLRKETFCYNDTTSIAVLLNLNPFEELPDTIINIYDLSEFIKLCEYFLKDNKVVIEVLGTDYVIFKNDKTKLKYNQCEVKVIQDRIIDELEMNKDVELILDEDTFKEINNLLKILSSELVFIEGRDDGIYIGIESSSYDRYSSSFKLTDDTIDKFKFTTKDFTDLVLDSYKIELDLEAGAKLVGSKGNFTYFLSLESPEEKD